MRGARSQVNLATSSHTSAHMSFVVPDAAETLTPWDVLLDLYDREINAGVQTDWDGGIVVWIGLNPILSITRFAPDKFGQVASWMAFEARRLFPQAY